MTKRQRADDEIAWSRLLGSTYGRETQSGPHAQRRRQAGLQSPKLPSSREESSAITAAKQIARDTAFRSDLEYLDENAERLGDLGKRIRAPQIQQCGLCDGVAPVLAAGSRVTLTVSSAPLHRYHCLIMPRDHHASILDCDADERTEIRNYMKSLTRMFATLKCSAVFWESAVKAQHCVMECMPVPCHIFDHLPRYFREALSAESDDAQIIDTLRDTTFFQRMSSQVPYIHIWFDLDGGLGHPVENIQCWPRDDLWTRQVLATAMRIDLTVWRKRRKPWRDYDEQVRVFKRKWDKFDWTKALLSVTDKS
ncbi:Pre-mRNA-splicing factor cwf19 [Savitreella phatthalungensis]